ncbi:hypothetical protein ACOMHN_007134 [Nucella lapillus]
MFFFLFLFQLFLVLGCLVAITLALVEAGRPYYGHGRGYHGGGAGYHGGRGAGLGYGVGNGAGYGHGGLAGGYGHGGLAGGYGHGGLAVGYGHGGLAGGYGHGGLAGGYGHGGLNYGGLGAGNYGAGVGGHGLGGAAGFNGGARGLAGGLAGGLGGAGLGFNRGGAGAAGVVRGTGQAAADDAGHVGSHSKWGQVSGARARDYGRNRGGFGNDAARAAARARLTNSAYGHHGGSLDQNANAARALSDKATGAKWDRDNWWHGDHWNKNQKHLVDGKGNNWHQGRRKHDDLDYAYDKSFDLRDNENGGFVLAESDNKHALDHLKDRDAGYNRNINKDAAHASSADAQKADHKASAFHNDAAHAANARNFGRDTANRAGHHGRNRDYSNKLDHSKSASRLWDDASRSGTDVYKKLATDHGSHKKQGTYGPGAYGLGLAPVGPHAAKPGYYAPYGDGYAGDGYYGGADGYVGAAPLAGHGYVGAAPVGGHGYVGAAPVGGHGYVGAAPVGGHGYVGAAPLGGHGYVGGGHVGGGHLVGGPVVGGGLGGVVSPAGVVGAGGGLVGPAGVVGAAGPVGGLGAASRGRTAARGNSHSARDALRRSDDAASRRNVAARYNRDQWLRDRATATDKDAHAAASDKGHSDWAQKAAHSANKADAAHADAARASEADRAKASFDENLWKKEAEKTRLTDRNNNHKVYKKWFNNKRRGGDNKERLNLDRDHKDDVFGNHAAARKHWALSDGANRWNNHHGGKGAHGKTASQAVAAQDLHEGIWKDAGDGYQKANAASNDGQTARQRGWNNGAYTRDAARNGYGANVHNIHNKHRDTSRAGLANAAGTVTAGAGGLGTGLGVGGGLGTGLGGGLGTGLGAGGAYGSGLGGYGGAYGNGLGGNGGAYGNGLGGYGGAYGNGGGYGNGLGYGGGYGNGLGYGGGAYGNGHGYGGGAYGKGGGYGGGLGGYGKGGYHGGKF